jgi:predicted RecB family nuclease
MTEFRFNPEKTMVENYNDNETLMYQQVEEIFSDKLIQNNPGIVK